MLATTVATRRTGGEGPVGMSGGGGLSTRSVAVLPTPLPYRPLAYAGGAVTWVPHIASARLLAVGLRCGCCCVFP